MPLAHGGQKSALNLLELELWIITNLHMGALLLITVPSPPAPNIIFHEIGLNQKIMLNTYMCHTLSQDLVYNF